MVLMTMNPSLAALDAHRLEAEALGHLFEDVLLGGSSSTIRTRAAIIWETGSEG
jgi:hypothetical protein